MDRRDALRYTGWMAGAGLLTPGILASLQSCANSSQDEGWRPRTLTDAQVGQLILISDTIVPTTKTPSASEVRVHEFIDLLVTDVLSEEQNNSLIGGLDFIDSTSRNEMGKPFSDLSGKQRFEVLENIDSVAFSEESSGEYSDDLLQNYKYLKSLILLTYFTSEEGVRQNLNYVAIPGDYIGCMDLPDDGKITIGNHM